MAQVTYEYTLKVGDRVRCVSGSAPFFDRGATGVVVEAETDNTPGCLVAWDAPSNSLSWANTTRLAAI